MIRKTLFLVGLAVCLYGCPHAEKYSRPGMPVPPGWPESAAPHATMPAAPLASDTKWHEYYIDKRLQAVIELALANNRDLRIAALNIEKTQALYRIQRGALYPNVGVLFDGQAHRLPEKMTDDGRAKTVEQYSVNVGTLSWEVDLFGRLRSLKSAALEQYLATEQARSATQISLVAAVANSYLALAADREYLRLANATFDAQQATYELILRTRDVGIASDLDLRQAQSQVEVARVDIARYSGFVALDENALNLLAGTSVPANLLPSELAPDRAVKDISSGLPSEVLLNRPDILGTEHQLKAAYANIGAARAAFFPRITLTAGAGTLSPELSSLFQAGTGTWSFAPQIISPLFTGGSLRASLKATQVDRDIAVADYERVIQSAFREVSDSLTLRIRLTEQQDAQQALVKALEETFFLSEARYKAGIDSYLSVLIAQRALYVAQQGLVNLRLAHLSNLVTLYKVLGGGA
jgi:outer membrane protein, multidrug efflux system